MKKMKSLFKNQKGQGMIEYILLLVIVVGLVVVFKGKIKGLVEGKMGDLEGQIQEVQ